MKDGTRLRTRIKCPLCHSGVFDNSDRGCLKDKGAFFVMRCVGCGTCVITPKGNRPKMIKTMARLLRVMYFGHKITRLHQEYVAKVHELRAAQYKAWVIFRTTLAKALPFFRNQTLSRLFKEYSNVMETVRDEPGRNG